MRQGHRAGSPRVILDEDSPYLPEACHREHAGRRRRDAKRVCRQLQLDYSCTLPASSISRWCTSLSRQMHTCGRACSRPARARRM